MVKQLLPEYNSGVGAGVVHEESSKIAKALLQQASENGENIIYPTVGSNLESLTKLIQTFKKKWV